MEYKLLTEHCHGGKIKTLPTFLKEIADMDYIHLPDMVSTENIGGNVFKMISIQQVSIKN